MSAVVVVPTGTANMASVLAGLRRAGAEVEVSAERAVVARATRLVLPGVGTFGAAMRTLRDAGLVPELQARVAAGRPTLAVCVGLQVLAEASDESPGVVGLGCLPGRVTRFGPPLRVPQLGWNRVEPAPSMRLVAAGHAYFANSYRLESAPPGFAAAFTDYGGPFVAALERGAVLACQFHPELSTAWGLSLLSRWLDASAAAAAASA